MSDLREAAERLRAAIVSEEQIPCEYAPSYQKRRDALSPRLRYLADCELLARAYLAETQRLKVLASNAVLMARHGDYSDAAEDAAFLTSQALTNLDAEAAALGLVIGPTFYDNEKRYGALGVQEGTN